VVSWERCTGCKLCTIACPYGTMFYDGDTGKAYKCNLCGGAPACAVACPTEAITYEDMAMGDFIGDFAGQRTARLLRADTDGGVAAGPRGVV